MANIAAHWCLEAIAFKYMIEQVSNRCLAICAGNSDPWQIT